MLDLSNSLNAAMYSISSPGESSPTGSGQHGLAVSDDEQPDIDMIDAGTENVNERLKSVAREAPLYMTSNVSEAPNLLKISKGRMASEYKHSTTSHPEKTYASDTLKIQQIHAFDCGSDQEISTA